MNLVLERFAYTPTDTQGVLTANGERFYTIERPWIPGPNPGGMSMESCVPDGKYKLVKHTRPDGTKTVALVNPRLGVWHQEWDRPQDWGRFLILIHSGNHTQDIIGCIAPGLWRTHYQNRIWITNSRAAMRRLNPQRFKTLTIRPALGAVDEGFRT